MTLTPGTALGPYEILEPLGSGGMGQVYRARDTRLHRQVAIKVMHDAVVAQQGLERFQREARAASALNHPHICAVYDIGEVNGQPFLVMELIEGQTLHDFMGARALEPQTARAFGLQIADALETAHARGVIHRDIKPGNIMITGRQQVKVLDFGLARYLAAGDATLTKTVDHITRVGTMMGTPQYMAPEIYQGLHADARADLWALGVVLYRMVTGRPPFSGATAIDVGAAVLHDAVPPLPESVPMRLRGVVERLLVKQRDNRIQTAREVREALEDTGPHREHAWGADADRPRTVTGAPASLNPEANDAFTLAAHFMRVQNDLARGQEQLERALELDPHFAEARRVHAFNFVVLFLNGFTNDVTLLYKAEDELREAERDDPTLASLPSAFAAVYLAQGRKDMIPASMLGQSLEDSAARRMLIDEVLWRAIIAWMGGESGPAAGLLRQLLERDPMFAAPRMILGEVLRCEGDVRGAIREQLRVLAQAGGNVSAIRWLTLAHLDAGEIDSARALLEKHRQAFSGNFLWRSACAVLLACEGQKEEALALLDRDTLTYAAAAFFATLDVAEIYAVLGDTASAVGWVQTAVRNGDERIGWFRRNPRLVSIQADPRFRQILQSVDARRKTTRPSDSPLRP